MDLSTDFENSELVEFTITLDGVYRHFDSNRICVLDRIARFHGYTTTGEYIGEPPEIRLLRSVR